ncbi:uncharacterized protein LOC124694867 isoform X2 [Lolium rigidum]|uniref:uncharacterized protein LOC124694867 isoform X2 n=1 Tax=Lolium rigidum TaxID=89674 RepID=UPI001F5DCA16|nr:uncharacterized protein LOC124694867 isoform X2 [Lolium rigidum]XP_047083755.1 uncharacterized protein LOC124694867 isoform X2 [Lolium rigidum]
MRPLAADASLVIDPVLIFSCCQALMASIVLKFPVAHMPRLPYKFLCCLKLSPYPFLLDHNLLVQGLFLPWFCTFHSVKSGVWLDLFDCKILHLGICYGWRSGVIPCKLFIFQLGPRFSSATSLSARHLFVQRPELKFYGAYNFHDFLK